ncbi:hypothetical protein [Kitasatospora sp. NPDC088346]|uniref:hypothetical protein n=1 Tax=Kitasatospora sp. NPDC088346 TaxID=3364073 RepID=UPI0038204441
MVIPVPTSDITNPRHLFVPYRTADGGSGLQIVHTGTMALDAGSDGGAGGDDLVTSFVPYGNSGSGGLPTAGSVQDFNGLRAAAVVTGSLAGIRVASADARAFIEVSTAVFGIQPNLTGTAGEPLCLFIGLRVSTRHAHIGRLSYQATVTVAAEPGDENGADILQHIPDLIPAGDPHGSMVGTTHIVPDFPGF